MKTYEVLKTDIARKYFKVNKTFSQVNRNIGHKIKDLCHLIMYLTDYILPRILESLAL